MYQAADIVSASFSFENEILGSGTWCFSIAQSAEKDIITIMGSHGTIKFGTFADSNVVLETDKAGREEFTFDMPEHIQEHLIQLVVNDLLGKGVCPSNGISAARTNLAMEKICGSLENLSLDKL